MNDIIPQTMVNNSLGVGYKARKGTTTHKSIDDKTKCAVISSYYFTPKKLLIEHLPTIKGIRHTTLFKILIITMVNDGITQSYYTTGFNIKAYSIGLCLPILVEMGFIKQIGRPRYIVPFGKYKVETGYKILTKGETVLNKLLNY